MESFRKAPQTSDGTRPQWRPIPAWTWMLIAVAAVVLTAFGIITWLLTIASHAAAGTDLTTARLDAVRTGLAAGAGAGAAVGLMLAFRRQHHQEIATLLTDQDATQRRITELYTKAVEQLGSDKAPVRFGGLYALERLPQDNLSQRQTIVNVICAYLRMPFPASPDSTAAPNRDEDAGARAETETTSAPPDNVWQQESQVRLTAQRILSDHLRQEDTGQSQAEIAPSRLWHGIRLDLTGATLIDFNLGGCFIGNARFDAAIFSGDASFDAATFSGDARFGVATFIGDASFDAATFEGNARFDRASFGRDTRFAKATFNRIARFDAATFGGDAGFGEVTFGDAARFAEAAFNGDARFAEANFSRTPRFDGAIFNGTARFTRATFQSGARFAGATFNGSARFTEATFRRGPTALSFQNALVGSPGLPHAWPDGWQLDENANGATVVPISSSTTPGPE